MFDPSKLNIDFSDLEGNTGGPKKDDDDKKKKEEKKLEEEKLDQGFNLDAFSVPESDEKEEKVEEKKEIKEEKVEKFEIKEEKIEEQTPVADLESLLDETAPVIEEKKEVKKEEPVENKIEEKVVEVEEEDKKEEENPNVIKLPEEPKNEAVIDMSLSSLDDLVDILLKENYDFIVVEPTEDYAKVTFKKDQKEVETKNINVRVYSKVVFKAKQIGKMNQDKDDIEQKAEAPYSFKELDFKALIKVVPSPFGEKLFFKPKVLSKAKKPVKKQKVGIGKIFSFLSVVLLFVLILMGAFISFVVMNANSEEDVALFMQLGINIGEINTFIKSIVLTVFTVLVFIESIFLAIFTFRALLTKAEFKRKKAVSGFMALFMFICVVGTGSFGLSLYKWELPDWPSLRLGKIQIYDNDKLNSSILDKEESLLRSTDDLIGPITIKYNLSRFRDDKLKEGFKISEYVWKFGDEEITKQSPEIIHTFDQRGINRVSLKVVGSKFGEIKEFDVDGIKDVNLTGVIDYKETVYPTGGKKVAFDARDVVDYGKAKWFIYDIESDKISDGYEQQVYKPAKIFKKDTVILMKLVKSGVEPKFFDKMFFISLDKGSSNLTGEIEGTKSYDDPLEYTFKVKNLKIGDGNGFVAKYEWIIDGNIKTISKIDLEDQEKSSAFTYKFKTYGKKNVKLRVYDEVGNLKEIVSQIDIPRVIKLRKPLIIKNGDQEYDLKGIFNEARAEYSIEDLGAPTTLTFNAERVKAESLLYKLEKVSWDTDGDGNYDKEAKTLDFEVPYADLYNMDVKFNFTHIRNKEDKVEIKQHILIDAVEKEAQLSLKVTPDSEYAPTLVKFDATMSKVKDDDIVSFIYNYGDGTPEDVRDAYNPGHKYVSAGTYNVVLKVKTKKGKTYSISKVLTLKPKPEKAVITSSLKSAKKYQEISFTSSKSTGEIKRYFWDFGDGQSSSEAHPDHMYDNTGEYTVKLKLTFESGNVQFDEYKVTIQ